MTVIQFKRPNLVDEIVAALTDKDDPVVEALVIGKKKSGARFTFLTPSDNVAELLGYLEAVKTDLAFEVMAQAESNEE